MKTHTYAKNTIDIRRARLLIPSNQPDNLASEEKFSKSLNMVSFPKTLLSLYKTSMTKEKQEEKMSLDIERKK